MIDLTRTHGNRRAITAAVGVASAVQRFDAVTAAVDGTAELGAPTILVNNAGILRDNLLFKMRRDWDAVIGVHCAARS